MRKRNVSLKRHTKFFVLYKNQVFEEEEKLHRVAQTIFDEYEKALTNLVNR